MDRDFLIDLFADFGPVTIRRMFSGYGIFDDSEDLCVWARAALAAAQRAALRKRPKPRKAAKKVAKKAVAKKPAAKKKSAKSKRSR